MRVGPVCGFQDQKGVAAAFGIQARGRATAAKCVHRLDQPDAGAGQGRSLCSAPHSGERQNEDTTQGMFIHSHFCLLSKLLLIAPSHEKCTDVRHVLLHRLKGHSSCLQVVQELLELLNGKLKASQAAEATDAGVMTQLASLITAGSGGEPLPISAEERAVLTTGHSATAGEL